MNARSLGMISIVCALIAISDSLRLIVSGHQDVPGFRSFDSITAIAQIVGTFGTLCAVVALILLKATGTRPAFRFLSYVPVVGCVCSIIGFALAITGVPSSINIIGIIGQLLSMGGFLIVAILTIAANTWKGWRKFTPLLCIVAIPLGAVVVGLTGLDGLFSLAYSAAALLLGYAIVTGETAGDLSPSPA